MPHAALCGADSLKWGSKPNRGLGWGWGYNNRLSGRTWEEVVWSPKGGDRATHPVERQDTSSRRKEGLPTKQLRTSSVSKTDEHGARTRKREDTGHGSQLSTHASLLGPTPKQGIWPTERKVVECLGFPPCRQSALGKSQAPVPRRRQDTPSILGTGGMGRQGLLTQGSSCPGPPLQAGCSPPSPGQVGSAVPLKGPESELRMKLTHGGRGHRAGWVPGLRRERKWGDHSCLYAHCHEEQKPQNPI